MVHLRPFCNLDLPHLVRIWNGHYLPLGMPTNVTPNLLDATLLGKPWFAASQLTVAEVGGQPTGFIHAVPAPHELPGERDPSTVVSALCVADHPRREEVARALRDSVLEGHAEEPIRVGFTHEMPAGFVGVMPEIGLLGVPSDDVFLRELLQEVDLRPTREIVLMQLSIATFRPPVDRHLLKARRAASVEGPLDTHPDDWQLSAALGHLEEQRYLLRDRARNEFGAAEVWSGTPEFGGLPHGTAYLAHTAVAPHPMLPQTALFKWLASGVIANLATHRFTTLQAARNADAADVPLLEALGFRTIRRGTVMRRPG